MDKILNLIDRDIELFKSDINKHHSELQEIISSSSFLVLGAAGSIGKQLQKKFLKEIQKNSML